MQPSAKATSIRLMDVSTPQMRAFHMTWFAFFLCFFAWFGIAPLMSVVRDELRLTKEQLGWTVIGSVAITVFARLAIGKLCDHYGPRIAYSWLLVLGSIPVMAIGFAHNFETFLLFRVMIGAIGASFVVTQYHTSLMFAPNCVGTANATTAGWGNLGGGITQMVMPILFGLFVTALGFAPASAWRICMFMAGVTCFLAGIAYYFLTQDTPEGNFRELRAAGKLSKKSSAGTFLEACKDHRVWALFIVYGACFGIELTMHNVALLYFVDYFPEFKTMDSGAALRTAGLIAGSFGAMSLFARTLGGYCADRMGGRWGLSGRVKFLFVVLFCEGLSLMCFSQMRSLALAIPLLILVGLFVQMAAGGTFAVVPFVNQRALGSVAGIVGAGGNMGAIASGFLFKSSELAWNDAMLYMGLAVTVCSFASFAVTFSKSAELEVRAGLEAALRSRRQQPETVAAV